MKNERLYLPIDKLTSSDITIKEFLAYRENPKLEEFGLFELVPISVNKKVRKENKQNVILPGGKRFLLCCFIENRMCATYQFESIHEAVENGEYYLRNKYTAYVIMNPIISVSIEIQEQKFEL